MRDRGLPLAYDAAMGRHPAVRRALGALAAVIVASLAGGIAWVARMEPLVHGDYFSCGLSHVENRGRACVLRYEHGEETIWAFVLRNDGPVAVTVAGVPYEEGHLLDQQEVLLWPENGPAVFELRQPPLVPFATFTLRPGEERLVAVRARFDNCERYDPGTGETLAAVGVRFRVFGLSRHASVGLWRHIEVESPADCPDR